MLAVATGDEPRHGDGSIAHVGYRTVRESVRERGGAELESLLADCLAKRPDDRPTMDQIADRLASAIERLEGTRPPAPSWVEPRAIPADELAAHTTALEDRLAHLDDAADHDEAIRIALAKAECHRRERDFAGSASTLESTLARASRAAAERTATAWLALGEVDVQLHRIGNAVVAFDHAVACASELASRAHGHLGAGLALLTRDADQAVPRLRLAAALVADELEDPEARAIHTDAVLALARAYREIGDLPRYRSSIDHVVTIASRAGRAVQRTLVHALGARGDIARARDLLGLDDDGASADARLLGVWLDLEVARSRSDGAELARRARDAAEVLVREGNEEAPLALAVAVVYLAWFSGEAHGLDGALAILDEAAATGRDDLAKLAAWARSRTG
jgi:hypothetical protein